jgi:hypothetical protein
LFDGYRWNAVGFAFLGFGQKNDEIASMLSEKTRLMGKKRNGFFEVR